MKSHAGCDSCGQELNAGEQLRHLVAVATWEEQGTPQILERVLHQKAPRRICRTCRSASQLREQAIRRLAEDERRLRSAAWMVVTAAGVLALVGSISDYLK